MIRGGSGGALVILAGLKGVAPRRQERQEEKEIEPQMGHGWTLIKSRSREAESKSSLHLCESVPHLWLIVLPWRLGVLGA
jgi:hypothetical protein